MSSDTVKSKVTSFSQGANITRNQNITSDIQVENEGNITVGNFSHRGEFYILY